MHTGQTWVLGSAPNSEAQPQKALVRLLSCTCVSMPITASYLSTWRRRGGRRACVGWQQGWRGRRGAWLHPSHACVARRQPGARQQLEAIKQGLRSLTSPCTGTALTAAELLLLRLPAAAASVAMPTAPAAVAAGGGGGRRPATGAGPGPAALLHAATRRRSCCCWAERGPQGPRALASTARASEQVSILGDPPFPTPCAVVRSQLWRRKARWRGLSGHCCRGRGTTGSQAVQIARTD